jgi:putative ABC transport system substrate-binding protein
MKPPSAIGRRAAVGVAMMVLARGSLAAVPGGPFLVGMVTSQLTRSTPQFMALENRVRKAGYGDDLTFDLVAAHTYDENTRAVRDLVRRGADIILALGNEGAVRAARAATSTVPIVVLGMDYDPLAKGYVASLAHPGGNITGVNVRQVELAAKRAEMLLAAAPGTRRVIVLSDMLSEDQQAGALERLRVAGIAATKVELHQTPYDYDAALGDADGRHGDALLLMTSPTLFDDCDEIAAVALKRRLPSSFAFSEFPTRGGLMSYGVDTVEVYGMVGDYIVRILKGGRPADLPMEQPNKFDLVINLKTAKALGLTIPPTLLALADDLIE